MHEAEVRAGKPSKAVLAAVMPLEDASASQLDTPKGVIWVIAHIVITLEDSFPTAVSRQISQLYQEITASNKAHFRIGNLLPQVNN